MGKAMNLQEVKFCRKQGLELRYIEKNGMEFDIREPGYGKALRLALKKMNLKKE